MIPVLKVALAAGGLFAVAGYGVVRLALAPVLRRHELVWVLPVGACVAALELTLLGFAFVPFDVSLGLVVAAGLATAAIAIRRRGDHAVFPRDPGRTIWPLYVAALLAAFILVPLYHAGYPTVIGDGSDAHLAAGTGQYLQSHPPLGHAATEPVNRVPVVWRSKTPIYYALAAVASLSGLPTWEVLSPMMAVILGVALLGFFLLARELLRSNMLGALAAMGLVGLDRMVVHTAVHPYYNQLWGFMTMAPAIVLAWRAVEDRGRAPTRGTVGLLLLFLAIGAFAYPLELPIPVLCLAVFYWRARRARRFDVDPMPPLLASLRRRTEGRRGLRWLIFLLLVVPLLGVAEKLSTGFAVAVDPTRSLFPWAGDVSAYFPTHQFFSVESAGLLWVAIPLGIVGVVLAIRRAPGPVAWGVVAVLLLGVVGSFWFHHRDSGQYFDFKLLAFVGPLAVTTVAVGASRLPVIGWIALAAFGLTAFHGADSELAATGNQLPPAVRDVSRIPALIGPDRSVRLDMNPPLQIWVAYFLHAEPLCSQRPLLQTSYPHVAVSRKADFILADHFTFPPFDAVGPPIAAVGQFELYRERADIPGRDRCSRTRVQTVRGVG